MNVGQTPPYRVTKQELRAIGRNTDRALAGNPKSPACSIARMRTKMYLTHAGVPDDQHIQAATEASYRMAFSQDTEAQIARAVGGQRLLQVVPADRLGREPFPEHLMRT